MSNLIINEKAKSQEIHAVITRADGTVEDLGVISYWNRNPLLVWAWKMKQFFKNKKKG